MGCGVSQTGAARRRARPERLVGSRPAPARPPAASVGLGRADTCGSRPARTASSRERTVGPLELFYDLAVVVLVAQAAHHPARVLAGTVPR